MKTTRTIAIAIERPGVGFEELLEFLKQTNRL